MMRNEIALALLLHAASMPAIAMSKPFDAVAGVILRGGTPCFYSSIPLDDTPPSSMKDMGLEFSVFNKSSNEKGYVWDVWFKAWPKPLPMSPATCVSYGTISPDKNITQARPLPYDAPLSFWMTGSYGRHSVSFCIRKDGSGSDYLSAVVLRDGIAECTSEPLMNERR